MNLMKHLGMLEGKVVMSNPPVDPPTERVYAHHGGIWRMNVKAGQKVYKGENLGNVSSLTGDKLQGAVSPLKGVISFLRTSLSVNEGDTLFYVTEI